MVLHTDINPFFAKLNYWKPTTGPATTFFRVAEENRVGTAETTGFVFTVNIVVKFL